MAGANSVPIVIVTGLSGAGKSIALRVFEDMGFFCVDGLPVSMVPKLASLYEGQTGKNNRGLAIGMDIRQRDFLDEWSQAQDELAHQGVTSQMIFLDASTEELMRRYAETRRPHPLESEELGLEQALTQEREILEPLRAMADLVIDTTQYSIHDLRRTLQEKWAFLDKGSGGLRIHIISFGFKHGPPKEADIMFDLRFLPNPYFVEDLRDLTGADPKVAAYVFKTGEAREFESRLIDFLTYLVPLYAREGRYRLTLAMGCTGGKHRSVAVATRVFEALKDKGYSVSLEHRHMDRC